MWLPMKRKYMILSMMISGPIKSENDIDKYLNPLIKDLRVLSEKDVDFDEAYLSENFKMRVMLFS